MEKAKLNNGVEMPSIGFGTWQLDRSQTKESVEFALKSGYRLIDTAKIYGNEEQVGEGITASGVERSEIFVTTKLWNSDQGYNSTLKAFDKSLKKLKLEYLDLYLLHWPVIQRLESWSALEELYKSGKIKSIGVSNFTKRHLEELLLKSNVIPVVNQIEFHPFLYEEQKPLLEYCKDNQIIVEAYSPLAHGTRLNESVITKIASEYRKTNAQILLRWALQHGTVPLPKSSNQPRITENLDIFDFELSKDDMNTLNSLSDGTRTCGDPNELD